MSTPPSPSQSPASLPRRRNPLDRHKDLTPTQMQVFRILGWIGLVACIVSGLTLVALGRPGAAALIAADALAALPLVFIHRLGGWLQRYRRICWGLAAVAVGALAVGFFYVLGLALWARNWEVAALFAVLGGPLALAIPPRARAHASDFRAINAGIGMDERRQQIHLQARAGSFRILEIIAAAVCCVSVAVNLASADAPDSGAGSVDVLRVWPPALWLLLTCVALELAAIAWHSCRM